MAGVDGPVAGDGAQGPVVFVSYSHADRHWLARFEVMLAPEVRGRGLQLWVDTAIGSGRVWRAEIGDAIGRADVALLLVSPDFLASEFVMDCELPELERRCIPLACVLLRACRYKTHDALERVQWTHDPERPIAQAADVDDAVKAVTDSLLAMLDGTYPDAAEHAPDGRRDRTGRCVRFNFPATARPFVGRDKELDVLDDALKVNDRVTITGLGGAGKSQLAGRYVETRAERYDVVAWIRAEDGGILDLARLAVRVGGAMNELSPGERAEWALDWLRASASRWLLVLDNVARAEQLERLLPSSPLGRVLVTSRDRATADAGPIIEVNVFDEDTATEYLVWRAGRPHDERDARRVAIALGCLPLALAHAAALCATGTSFGEYLQFVRELPARELFDAGPELFHAETVALTWQASISAAGAIAPLAPAVLRVAAYLGPDDIPRSLLAGLIEAPRGVAGLRVLRAFGALARFSLATVDDDNISVHRVVQKVVRDDIQDMTAGTDAVRAVYDAFADVAVHDSQRGSAAEPAAPGAAGAVAAAGLPGDGSMRETWKACEQLLPHVLALADIANDLPDELATNVLDLHNRAIRYLLSAGERFRAVDVAITTADLAGLLHRVPVVERLIARIQLADAHQWMGHTRTALPIAKHVANDCVHALGLAHPVTLKARVQLALSYQWKGLLATALLVGREVVENRQRILGREHPDTIAARIQLSWSLSQAGHLEEALSIRESVLEYHERVLGSKAPATLWTRATVALSYRSAGRIDEAIELFERTARDRHAVLGELHPDTLWTRANLGKCYELARRHNEAIAILRAVVADYEHVLGPSHSDALGASSYLASAYEARGRIRPAIAINERVLPVRERIMPAHPDTVDARAQLARSYFAAGRTDDAIAVQRRVLSHSQRVYGSKHPATLEARSNLARWSSVKRSRT